VLGGKDFFELGERQAEQGRELGPFFSSFSRNLSPGFRSALGSTPTTMREWLVARMAPRASRMSPRRAFSGMICWRAFTTPRRNESRSTTCSQTSRTPTAEKPRTSKQASSPMRPEEAKPFDMG
jgi:hypothetical protein